jgi:hypothetical protein
MSIGDLITFFCLGVALWYVPRYLLRVYAPGLMPWIRSWWQQGIDTQRARYERRAPAYGLRDVNDYQDTALAVMSYEPNRQPQTAQTDRQTSVSVADQWLDRLEVDRTRAALIELLVYSEWSLSEIRSMIKGDNGTIGAEVEAARQRLEKPPRLMHVNNERYIPLDAERVV